MDGGYVKNCFEPNWFPGISVPESLTCIPTPADKDSVEATSSDNEESESGNAWSDNSDDSDENECDGQWNNNTVPKLIIL